MITPYLRPQDTITQILQQTAARTASRRNPVVIGPQYTLFLNDGRDLSAAKKTFSSDGGTFNYLNANGAAINLSNLKPLTAEAKLFGENLEAEVAAFGAGLWEVDLNRTNWRAVRIGTNTIAGAGTLNTTLDGRQVQVGDVLECDWDDGVSLTGTTRRRVVGLLGVVTPSSIPADASALGPYNPTTSTQTLEAVAANTSDGWTVDSAVTTAGLAVFRAHGHTVLIGGARKLGDLITCTCTTGGAADGEAVFTVTALATGLTASVTAAEGSGVTKFVISLATVGYSSCSIIMTHTGDASIGDTFQVKVTPAYTAKTVGTISTGGTYTGTRDRRYAVEILAIPTASEADIRVYDVSGEDPAVTYSDAVALNNVAVGTSGFTINLDEANYVKGEIFFVDATAAVTSGTQSDGVLLDGPAVPAAVMEGANVSTTTLESVKVFQRFTGVLDSSNSDGGIDPALTATDEDWTYAADLGLNQADSGRATVGLSPFADGYGKILLSYKALVIPSATEGVIELDSELEIAERLGETKLENWLARGALEAFKGNQNSVVYALRTAGDTVEDFTTALRKIQTTDQVYALAPMTDVQDVMELVASHCDTMSNKFKKNFRRCYVGTDSPGSYVHWGALHGGGYRRGDLASSVFTLAEEFRDSWKFVEADVNSDIAIQSLGLSFAVVEVLNDYEVLTDADTGLSATNTGITITREDSPTNNALFVIARSKALASRRAVNVWCDDPTIVENGVTTVMPMKFVAAEIAGLRCALLPQQGLTMTEILSVDAAPSMYTTFDPELLDDVAANGTMIITQDAEGGDVFIRHQLTTSTTAGALAYEDNVGVIVDEFAYGVKDEFRSYIGRRNATPDTISEIDDKLIALATSFTQTNLTNRQIGPAVLTFFDEKGNEGQVTVRQDGDLADTLLTYVKLRVPLPLNGLNHYIDVEVAEVLASADN
jgi:hypothetical protein